MEEKGAFPRSPGTPRNLFRGEEEGYGFGVAFAARGKNTEETIRPTPPGTRLVGI